MDAPADAAAAVRPGRRGSGAHTRTPQQRRHRRRVSARRRRDTARAPANSGRPASALSSLLPHHAIRYAYCWSQWDCGGPPSPCSPPAPRAARGALSRGHSRSPTQLRLASAALSIQRCQHSTGGPRGGLPAAPAARPDCRGTPESTALPDHTMECESEPSASRAASLPPTRTRRPRAPPGSGADDSQRRHVERACAAAAAPAGLPRPRQLPRTAPSATTRRACTRRRRPPASRPRPLPPPVHRVTRALCVRSSSPQVGCCSRGSCAVRLSVASGGGARARVAAPGWRRARPPQTRTSRV